MGNRIIRVGQLHLYQCLYLLILHSLVSQIPPGLCYFFAEGCQVDEVEEAHPLGCAAAAFPWDACCGKYDRGK